MKKKQNSYHLEDLNIEIRTEVELSDRLILPLFFKTSNMTEKDIGIAYSYFENNEREKTNSITDFKKIKFEGDNIILDYKLELQEQYNQLADIENMKRIFKFVDLQVLNLSTPKCRQFKDVEELYEYLINVGFDYTHFEIIFKTFAYFVKMIHSDILVVLDDIFKIGDKYKEDEKFTLSLLELQGCYEDLGIPYFPENDGVGAKSKWSYREQECHRRFKTKNNMITNAIQARIKKEAENGGKR